MIDLAPFYAARVAPEKRKLSPSAALNFESNSKERLDMSEEIWKPVKGYEGYYEVSNAGRVRSNLQPKPRILKPRKSLKGYLRVGLYANKKQFNASVHRLVLIAFKGDPPEGKESSHLNAIKSDNRVENLEWETKSENCLRRNAAYSYRGESSPNPTLTDRQVLEIRDSHIPRIVTQEYLARKYGVTQTAISQIIRRTSWTHI